MHEAVEKRKVCHIWGIAVAIPSLRRSAVLDFCKLISLPQFVDGVNRKLAERCQTAHFADIFYYFRKCLMCLIIVQ